MKAVRYVIYALIALVLLAVIAVAVAVTVIDPNTYKPQIENVVEDATNLELDLAGDIGWSFIPLGLELNSVEATLNGQRLVALEQMVAQVDFWSLIAMAPRVNTFVLDGLDARASELQEKIMAIPVALIAQAEAFEVRLARRSKVRSATV